MKAKKKVNLRVVVNQEYSETYIYLGFPVRGTTDSGFLSITILRSDNYLEQKEDLIGCVSFILEGELLKKVPVNVILDYVNSNSKTWESLIRVADFETIAVQKEKRRFLPDPEWEIVILETEIDPEKLRFLDFKSSRNICHSITGEITINLVWRDYGRSEEDRDLCS